MTAAAAQNIQDPGKVPLRVAGEKQDREENVLPAPPVLTAKEHDMCNRATD